LGDAADRNEIDAGLSDGADRFEANAARGFERHAAADQLDRTAERRRVHVVEQEAIGASCERFLDLLDPVDLDLNLEARIGGLCGSNRGPYPAGDRDMVVLDENSVVEPHPVIVRTAYPRSVFSQRAQAGDRFARVEDNRSGAVDCIDVAACERGDSREVLERVERRAFGGEHGPGISGETHHYAPRFNPVAVAYEHLDLDGWIELPKEGFCDFQSRNDDRLAGGELGGEARIGGDGRVGCDVSTLAQIFNEHAVHEVVDVEAWDHAPV
jgi:hypothetical protein